jgi:hypothetical protein
MDELEKLSHALGDLADVVDLDKLVDRLSSIDAEDVVDPDEVFRALAHALSGAAEWLGDIAGSARETGARVAGGSARWVVPLGAGAAVYAAARNAPAIARSVREHAPEAPDLELGSRVKELTHVGGEKDGSSGRRRSTEPRTLRNHLRARAAHRERRRKQFFTR